LPGGGSLPAEVERRARAVAGVASVKLELTFDPPWSKDCMSEAAKLALGIDDLIHCEAARMKLSANEEYGVRCLVRLAYATEAGTD